MRLPLLLSVGKMVLQNGYAGVKGDMIYKLRRIAVSMTGEECDKAIDDLKESQYWS